MSAIKSAKDHFYIELQNKKEQIALLWPGIDALENTQFYELCQKYSDIALNADKQRIPGTCDVQGCFQFADIDIAKQATKDYVLEWKIKDIEVLLALIHEFHSRAVEWDDKRTKGGRVLPENYDYQSMYAGKLFDFTRLPEDIWQGIAKEVQEYICN